MITKYIRNFFAFRRQQQTQHLFSCVWNEHTDLNTIKRYIQAGADVNARDGMPYRSVLEFAAEHNANPEVCEVLIKAGADVNARNDYCGDSPLMYAAQWGDGSLTICQVLIQAGADVNARNNHGSSPLMLVARNKPNPEICTLLIEAGADVNAKDNEGKKALDYADALKDTDTNSVVYWQLHDASFK